MKREIKFRAKRIDNGEWDYGYYVVHHIALTDVDKDTNQIVRVGTNVVHTLFNDQRKDNKGYYKDINPDTLGQFTGLIDKNGKEIYEGDIIGCHNPDIVHLIFYNESQGRFMAALNGDIENDFFGVCGLDDSRWNASKEVIGNIHDNLELLKGARNEWQWIKPRDYE